MDSCLRRNDKHQKSAFISVNPVYFKLIIHSTHYSLRNTHHAQRTPCHGDFFRIFSTFYVNVRIIDNIFVYRMQYVVFRIEKTLPFIIHSTMLRTGLLITIDSRGIGICDIDYFSVASVPLWQRILFEKTKPISCLVFRM